MRESFKKFAAISLLVGPILFIILTFIAMELFPGGWALGKIVFYPSYYKLDKNFFSDLGMLTTVTGKSNLPSSILFCIAMTLPGLAFIFHSITLSTYFTPNTNQYKYAKSASIAGIISAIGFIGVGFTPWDVLPLFHDIFVSLGFAVAGIYCFLFVVAVFKEKAYPNIFGFLSITYLIALIIYPILIYAGPPFDSFPGRILQVLLQKVVVYQMMILLVIEGISSLFLLTKRNDFSAQKIEL
jgi:hypothetical protein